MTIAIGGSGSGLLDTSLQILKRGDPIRSGEIGHGENIYINTSNGNLIIQHEDAFLPSLGEDFRLLRTYNSRGEGTEFSTSKWSFSTSLKLSVVYLFPHRVLELHRGDESLFQFNFDEARGLWVSTDGDGAYETITEISQSWELYQARYALTREDGVVLEFDFLGNLLRSTDPMA